MSANLIDVSLSAAQRKRLEQREDFGAALADCALNWHQQHGENAALDAITADSLTLLRRADVAAVVTVSTGGKLQIKAAHGAVEALRTALAGALPRPVWTVTDHQRPTETARRWPVSATLDYCAGRGSMICVPLGVGRTMFGTLLIMSFTAESFTGKNVTDATTLAIHASLALAAITATTNMQEAIVSRDVIGQAKGILMSSRQINADQAFAQLLVASQNSNTKLRQVAEDLCRTGALITVETGHQ